MSAPWLRRLINKRFAQKPTQPALRRLNLETLEDRSVPATAIWTGSVVPDVPITLPDGSTVLTPGSLRWSDEDNWLNRQRPENGDDVIFRGTPTTSTFFGGANSRMDLGITISSLTFETAGWYVIGARPQGSMGGQTVTLGITGAITSAATTGTNQIHFNYELSGNAQSISVATGGTLISAGNARNAPGADQVGILKLGGGTLFFSDNRNLTLSPTMVSGGAGDFVGGSQNEFTGVVAVDEGVLRVAAQGGGANSPLGTTDGATVVRNGATLSVSGSLNESIEITGDGVGGNGAIVSNGGGGTLSGGITITNAASIGVGLTPAGVRMQLSVTGAITGGTATPGATALTKRGDGELILGQANTFLGDTLVTAGILRVAHNDALSPGGATRVTPGGTLELRGNRLIDDETLILNGSGHTDLVDGLLGALYARADNNSTATAEWAGDIVIESAAAIGNTLESALVLSGSMSGSSALTKLQPGTVTFPNDNPDFTGNVAINNGVIVLPTSQGLGVNPALGPPSTITVNSTNGIAGTLQVVGSDLTVTKGLVLNGLGFNSLGALRVIEVDANDPDVNTDVTWTGPWTIGSTTSVRVDDEASLLVNGAIAGAAIGANLERNGLGTMTLTGDNTFLGALTLREGLTVINTNSALGGVGGGGTLVAGGATLRVASGITVTDEAVTLSGSATSAATLELMSGSTTFGGQFNAVGTNGGAATILTNDTASLTITGLLAGDAVINKNGTGTLVLAGTNNNSNTGPLQINDGTVVLNKTPGRNAVSGTVVVGDNTGLNNSATLRNGSADQLADLRDVTINADGLYNLNGFNETVRNLFLTGGEVLTGTAALSLGGNVTTSASNEESIITGNLNLGGGTRTFNIDEGGALVDLRVNAVIAGSTGAGIMKTGTGTMLLSGTNTYSGPTTVSAGVLRVALATALPNAPLILNGGTFDANGLALVVPQFSGTNGTLALGAGSLTFGSNGTLQTFAGTVTGTTGAQLTKVGGGIEIFTGNSSTFAGQTNVNGGELRVNGTLGGTAVVASGAALAGIGSVGTVSVANGGILSVGETATPAPLMTTGNVTLQGETQFVIDVATAAFDRLNAMGVVNLNGARLVLNVANLPTAGTSRTIVTGSNITGNFRTTTGTVLSNGTTFVLNGRVFRVDQSASDVSLVFVSSLVSAAVTSNNNPALPGANVTFAYTATAQNAADGTVTGTVEFFNVTDNMTLGTQTLSGGTASITTSFATTGTRQIEARFTPTMGSSFAASTVALSQAVNNSTATTVTAAPGPVAFGTAVTLTATVTSTNMGAPTPNAGMVQFVNAATGAVLASAMVNASGVASTSAVLPAGRLNIVAQYIGTGDFRASSATVQQLVTRQTLIATGAPVGSNGVMQVLDGETRQQMLAISLFGAQGTKVAVADVDNDGFSDLIVTQAAAIANPTIGIISGRDFSLLGVYQAIGFTGGINIAAGDVNGDGFADVIVGSATNGDLVRVYSGSSPNVIGQFNGMFGLNTGVTLAAGDIDGNGTAEIIVGTATRFFFAAAYNLSGALLANTPVQFAQAYTKGVNVAAGDLDGDGNAEIVLGTVADPFVVTFDPQTQAIGSFSAGTAGGVSVSTTDVNGDGIAEIVTSPTLGAPVIRRFDLFGAPLEDLFGPVVGPTIAGSSGL